MPKNDLIVYEGAMCCSTGVCGPEPDRKLIEFSETIKRLQAAYDGRLRIIRASLTFNTMMFIANKEVSQLVKENGQDILPITAVNGEIVAKQRYLTFDELQNILMERIQDND